MGLPRIPERDQTRTVTPLAEVSDAAKLPLRQRKPGAVA